MTKPTAVEIIIRATLDASTSNLMKLAYVDVKALPGKQWKCDMILELSDCIYGFSNFCLSYEEAKYCLCHIASD